MVIDLERERLLPLREVARLFPGRTGRGVSMATVWRWVMQGRKGICLETVFIGGQRYSSIEAVSRWVDRCNPCSAALPVRKVDGSEIAKRLAAEGF